MSCCCGPHISLEKTLYGTACYMCRTRADAIQIFLGSPTQYATRNFLPEDLSQTGELLRQTNKKLYVHSPYIINLASEDSEMVAKGKDSLQKILHTLSKVDTERTGTVLHIGAKGTLQNVINRINDIEITSPLYLENCAENCKFGKNMNELRKLQEGIDSNKVGFCIDTCHADASKLCDMRSSESIVKMFDELECKRTIVHLNDSKTEYGSGKDRHAILGFGTIWDYHKGESFESLITLRDYCKDNSYDIILETPSESIDTFELNILKR